MTPRARSLSPRAAEDLARADAARLRRLSSSLSFTSVRAALRWWAEARGRLQAPHNLYPRTEPLPGTEERVRVDVEGGRGGDLDDVLATATTIGAALDHLRQDYPQEYRVLVLVRLDGQSQAEVARRTGRGAATVSTDVGVAEGYLAGLLRGSGVLR